MSTQGWKKTNRRGVYEKNGRYRIRTKVQNHKGETVQRQKTLPEGATMREAIARRQEMVAEIKRPPDETLTSTIAGLAKRLLAQRTDSGRWSTSTAYHNRRILSQRILPVIGHIPAAEFDRSTVTRWIRWAEEQRKCGGGEYSQSTLKRWWKVVRMLVKRAYLEGHVEQRLVAWCREHQGPQSGVSGVREERTLSADELLEFVEAAAAVVPGHYAELATLSYTGMRAGELFGLEWGDVCYDTGRIHIRRAVWKGEIKETKTGRTRTVPMIPLVQDALEWWRHQQLREQRPGLEAGIVFPSEVGGRRYPSALTKPCRKAAKAAGIEQSVSPQVLRRTLNTLLATPDVDRLVLKSITGHNTDEMVEHYAGVRDESKLEALTRLTQKGGSTP